MDLAQKVLFGSFPRAVGTNTRTGQIKQWVVHSEGEFQVFFDTINGVKNAYASISWRPIGGNLKLDKVGFDFDTPQKEGEDGWPVFSGQELPQDEVVARMRNDPYVADEVLLPVLKDARKLIQRSAEMGIPTFCVFSGFGLHVYQMYREKANPDKQLDTTSKKFARELNLTTSDAQVGGDVKRILRIPNAHRVHLEIRDGAIVSTRPTGLFTIPLLPAEVMEKSPSELLEMAKEPRLMSEEELEYLHPKNRPEMKTYDDYLSSGSMEDVTQKDMRKMDEPANDDEFLEYLLKDYLKMPCMYERIQQPEPNHAIRRNCAVLLFNLGMEPAEVVDIFSRIGWMDWNREITEEQITQIYRKGYADMSCWTLRKEGFCTRADKPTDCPTFGWSGGKAEWK